MQAHATGRQHHGLAKLPPEKNVESEAERLAGWAVFLLQPPDAMPAEL